MVGLCGCGGEQLGWFLSLSVWTFVVQAPAGFQMALALSSQGLRSAVPMGSLTRVTGRGMSAKAIIINGSWSLLALITLFPHTLIPSTASIQTNTQLTHTQLLKHNTSNQPPT
jgi:hypothetical protein